MQIQQEIKSEQGPPTEALWLSQSIISSAQQSPEAPTANHQGWKQKGIISDQQGGFRNRQMWDWQGEESLDRTGTRRP